MQYIIYALLIIIVFFNLGTGRSKIQNSTGLMFFISVTICFAAINSTIRICKQSFGNDSWYLASTLPEGTLQPLLFRWSLLLGTKSSRTAVPDAVPDSLDINHLLRHRAKPRPPLQVSDHEYSDIKNLVLIYGFTYWHASAYGLLLSVFIPKVEIAMAIVPTISVTFLSCAGYFTTQNTIPYVLYPFKYLSFFRYGFEAGVMVLPYFKSIERIQRLNSYL
jgi:hypothetical protein